MKTKSKKAKAESANYLDYVPMHNEDKYPFQTDDNGAVTIMVENKGVFNQNSTGCILKSQEFKDSS